MRPCHLLPVSFLFQKSFVCFKSSNFVVGVFHHWRFPLSQREKEIENVFILFCWLVDDDGSLRTVTLLVRDLTWIAHEMTRKPKEMLRERQHSLNSFSRIFFCASSLFKWIPIPIMRLKNAHRWTNEWKKKNESWWLLCISSMSQRDSHILLLSTHTIVNVVQNSVKYFVNPQFCFLLKYYYYYYFQITDNRSIWRSKRTKVTSATTKRTVNSIWWILKPFITKNITAVVLNLIQT